MNLEEKKSFIHSLTQQVRDAVLKAADSMPEEWDGHEIRRYLADQFEREAFTWERQSRKRKSAYRSDVATRGNL